VKAPLSIGCALLVTLTALIWTSFAHAAHSHRYLIAKRVQDGISGTPLQGLGFMIEAEAFRSGLNPFFLVGAAGTESGDGNNPVAHPCGPHRHNVWGLGACNRYWNPPAFPTWKAAFHYYVGFIKSHWPRARTVYDLTGYCECGTSAWGNSTSAWMGKLFGDRSGSILYP
jgi:hypothetical protein